MYLIYTALKLAHSHEWQFLSCSSKSVVVQHHGKISWYEEFIIIFSSTSASQNSITIKN